MRKRAEERLEREELYARARSAEVVDAVGVAGVLDADAHPDVRWPFDLRVEPAKPRGTLRQNLELMPRCPRITSKTRTR